MAGMWKLKVENIGVSAQSLTMAANDDTRLLKNSLEERS